MRVSIGGLLVLFLTLVGIPVAFAGTYEVQQGELIQPVIAAAVSGDVIMLMGSEYNECVTISNKTLTFKGMGNTKMTSGESGLEILTLANSPNSIVEDISFDGGGTSALTPLVKISNSNGAVVRDCSFLGVDPQADCIYGTSFAPALPNVERCFFRGVYRSAFFGSSRFTGVNINRMTSVGTCEQGVWLFNGGGTAVASSVTNSIITGATVAALRFENGTVVTVGCNDWWQSADWIGKSPSASDFQLDPIFCGAIWTIDANSPCRAGGQCATLVGAFDVGCNGATGVDLPPVVQFEPTSWGHVKSLYR